MTDQGQATDLDNDADQTMAASAAEPSNKRRHRLVSDSRPNQSMILTGSHHNDAKSLMQDALIVLDEKRG